MQGSLSLLPGFGEALLLACTAALLARAVSTVPLTSSAPFLPYRPLETIRLVCTAWLGRTVASPPISGLLRIPLSQAFHPRGCPSQAPLLAPPHLSNV